MMPHHFSRNFFIVRTTTTTTIIILIAIYFSSQVVTGLGVGSTIAVSYSSTSSPIVCGILAGQAIQSIECYIYNNRTISVKPKTSFQSIAGGKGFFCGLRSGGYSLLCWNTTDFRPKRIHFDPINPLTSLTAGKSQICAVQETTGIVLCWRFPLPGLGLNFRAVTSGGGFSCGILKNNRKVNCWGKSGNGNEIETRFRSFRMLSLVAGLSHACGVIKNGTLICKGKNHLGQLHVPPHSPFEFSSNLALGGDHSCAIRRTNGFVVCWGGGLKESKFNNVVTNHVSFESIVAGLDFTCGLETKNLSIICWGPGWDGDIARSLIPIGKMIPGPCVQSSCNRCGVYTNSEVLCGGSGNICRRCEPEFPIPATPQPRVPSQGSRKRIFLAFAIAGSVGAFMGIVSILYCLWCGLAGKKVAKRPNLDNADAYSSTSRSISGTVRSYRSGASLKHLEKAESFTLSDLATATQGFSVDNKIGKGGFGMVYRGKLSDGREVAIKRGDTRSKPKKFQEKDTAFESELALLSRLHHKHLVDLIGFCEEDEERLLVYEYMSNGSLHDHLHKRNTKYINSWKVRIRIALGAARGIEYLHNYAVPPIIHRDIKSSNILLDAKFTAKVSDFGLSLMGTGPDSDQVSMSAKAVGTVGYIDPEYYVLNILTTKSDVYGFGVVLLEILTGKRAVFKEEGAGPMTVVEYARPRIAAGELRSVLDRRVESSEIYETEAIELAAYTALQCVNLEGIERPNMDDIVANLERALAICNGHHRRLSSTTFSGTSQ